VDSVRVRNVDREEEKASQKDAPEDNKGADEVDSNHNGRTAYAACYSCCDDGMTVTHDSD